MTKIILRKIISLEEANAVASATIAPVREELKRIQMEKAQPGQVVAGEGIYLCRWEPKDRTNKDLGLAFHVFAAPRDMPHPEDKRRRLRATFNNMSARIAQLKNWHGHDGCDYRTDGELYFNLGRGSYKGGWFIPPDELLLGVRSDYVTDTPNLRESRYKGAFRRSFSSDFCGYWSSTDAFTGPDLRAYSIFNENDALTSWGFTKPEAMARMCRPVRLVPV